MTAQATQILIEAAEEARKEETASREALQSLVTENASASALSLGWCNWQLAAVRLNQTEKSLAEARGKELDRIVTLSTVAVAIVFLLIVSISAALRVHNTKVVAKVTAPQVKFALGRDWVFPREITTSRVYISHVKQLGAVNGRAPTKFKDASIELVGSVTVTDVTVLPGTAVTLFAQKDHVTFGLVGAAAGITPAWLLSLKITAASGAKLTIGQGATGRTSEDVVAGTPLSIGVAFTPGLNASFELDEPRPWSLLLYANNLSFHDSEGLSTIIEGTLEVPNVAKSVPLGRYDDFVVGPKAKPVGKSVFNYDDKGILSIVQEYDGPDISIRVGSEMTNVVPTWLEYLLKKVGVVTTLNSVLVLVTALILWGLRARSIFRGER